MSRCYTPGHKYRNLFVLQANSGFPSSRKSHRASERQLADRVLEVQDYGGTQQVAIQQGDTTTLIQQDPHSSRPKLEIHDSNGVHTASKYKPLDTPGISVSRGGRNNSNTLVHVGEGEAKQTIELLKTPSIAAKQNTSRTAAEAVAGNSTQASASLSRAKGLGTKAVQPGVTGGAKADKTKSSFLGGGTTEDSAASSNVTEQASEDQKQAMAATDRQKSSSAGDNSSSEEDEHPKDPASRQADNGLSGPLSSIGLAAAAVASGVSGLVSNDSQVPSSSFPHLARCSVSTTCWLHDSSSSRCDGASGTFRCGWHPFS